MRFWLQSAAVFLSATMFFVGVSSLDTASAQYHTVQSTGLPTEGGTMTGDLTMSGADIDLNGNDLCLDADGNNCVSEVGDNQWNFDLGGGGTDLTLTATRVLLLRTNHDIKWFNSTAISNNNTDGELMICNNAQTGCASVDVSGSTLAVDSLVDGTAAGVAVANGADPGATCTVGEIFLDTDETDDTNCTTTADNSLCLCTATDTWTALENN